MTTSHNSTPTAPLTLPDVEPDLPPTRPLRRAEIWGGRLAMLGVTAVAVAIAFDTI